MLLRDKLLALCIVLIWGVNFVVIKVGLEGMPSLLLAFLRFFFVAFPAIFFVKRPPVPFKWLFIYGITISFGQFALLFWALKIGLPAGLASLIAQVQAFVTIMLGALLLKEKIKLHNIVAIILAAVGIFILAIAQGSSAQSVSLLALALGVAGASCWAMGNIANKVIMHNHPAPTMSLIVWSALVPTGAFALTSLLFDGSTVMIEALEHIAWHNIFSIAYLSFLATIVGYGGWSFLLSRYATSQVAPLSLLVPVFGLLSAFILLGEKMNFHQLIGGVIIAIALVINMFAPRFIPSLRHAQVICSNQEN
ncbi:EamA family transporter [Celerinatantimonas diazotrophica]|uniref:O-acetylserine/cysteine efflux transporter n=1 Tax=Celerinatantimonas diazotrophica TaxID=412034 RepID=A0A4R1K1M3_9GAMM|nr:EamA family transporter [Celerinatantimonas diazotrophica]TCK57898.1 O-acetylserine/cysteine efflux transporter [Celerinatantimonas diazotrophica]CAG9298034.1 putative amino-acid metabolite efflux pump [Celerinatantimonas diazotrophica]